MTDVREFGRQFGEIMKKNPTANPKLVNDILRTLWDGLGHRIEWAVASDDGSIYEVEDRTRERAEHEAALLREPDEDGASEPGAHVVKRKVCNWVNDLSA